MNRTLNTSYNFLPKFCLLLLETGWIDHAADTGYYFKNGAAEKVIVLKEYEIVMDYSINRAATDYLYTSAEGEKFTTQTDFAIDLYTNEEYVIRYLLETNYMIGIEPK